MAVRFFEKRGISFKTIQVDEEPEKRKEMVERSGERSVPQIFINDKHIGGYMELAELDMDGELDILLNE